MDEISKKLKSGDRLHAELKKWMASAHDAPDQSRAELGQRLGGFVIEHGDVIDGQDKVVVDEILTAVVRHTEKALRVKLADHLARLDAPPRKLIGFLASDEYEIAAPLLAECLALSEDDLIGACEKGERRHRLTIAGRPDVTDRLSETLSQCGEADVLNALTRNPKAVISREAFRTLVEQSETLDEIRRPLVQRRDLPFDLAHRMFWWTSSILRAAILERFPIPHDQLDEFLGRAVEEAAADKAVAATLRQAASASPTAMLRRMIDDLRAGRDDKIFVRFASMLNIEEWLARQILDDTDGEALAIACRAIDADRDQFTSLYLLLDYRKYGRPRPTAFFERAANAYGIYNQEQAYATVQLWNKDDVEYLAA